MYSRSRFIIKTITIFTLLIALFSNTVGVTPVLANTTTTINTTADEDNTGAACSLREAIIAANTDAAYGGCLEGIAIDLIILPAGTYTLNSQLPAITTTIVIEGNGADDTFIQADDAPDIVTYRVFEVGASGNLTLDSLTIQNGQCDGSCATSSNNGGGILNDGVLILTNSVISYNHANGMGGGIFNTAGSNATVTNSTFVNNSADANGGGISHNGSMTVTNSTFSSNSASGGGGGIFNGFDTLTVTNSTFSANDDSSNGGAIYNQATLQLKNTILANSISGADCYNNGGTVSGTNDLIKLDSSAGNACGTTAPITLDPQLGPLADNGGTTQTFALFPSSPALGAGTNIGCPSTDQRGVTRPQNSICDIGAYESNAQPGPTLEVNTNEDSDDGFCDAYLAGVTDCTLREAINYANNTGGSWTITFAANYTITLGSQLPAVTNTIIITGNGAASTIIQASTCNPVTLPGGCTPASYRVFSVATGNLTLNQLTVRHGVCAGGCATPNTVGGGISVLSGGILAINNSLVSANYADDGGGGLHNASVVTITNSTFSDNSTINSGGAITNQGTMTISNSTVANNTATSGISYAGGIRTAGISTTLNIYNSTISGNTSNSSVDDGSNIYQDSGTLNLYNTIIANGTDGDCFALGGVNASNNLIQNNGASDCGLNNGSNGNITGADPNLGSLTGSPAYFPLNAGSPAINMGDNTICAAAPVSYASQNGTTRPQGPNCDIGAFEYVYFYLFLPLIMR